VNPVVKRITASQKSQPEIVDGPTATTVGASSAPATVITFSVTVSGTYLVQRYVLLEPPKRNATLIVLEAPEAQWAGAEHTLMFTFNVT
jgi:hypothetical protein